MTTRAELSQPAFEPLTTVERKSLQTFAENTWDELQANKLGGYSGQNRPFWLVGAFIQVIENYGRRDTGYKLTQDEKAMLAAAPEVGE